LEELKTPLPRSPARFEIKIFILYNLKNATYNAVVVVVNSDFLGMAPE
jgi:hypothetical protein